jgi:hypothetical protein
VPSDDDADLAGELEAANARLSQSLKRCRKLVADYRSRLAQTPRPANDGSIFPWGKKPKQ